MGPSESDGAVVVEDGEGHRSSKRLQMQRQRLQWRLRSLRNYRRRPPPYRRFHAARSVRPVSRVLTRNVRRRNARPSRCRHNCSDRPVAS